jgi:hypothetical protein
MDVIGVDEQSPHGVVFGITSIRKPSDSLFVTIEHDWEDVRRRITPLVTNVMARIV